MIRQYTLALSISDTISTIFIRNPLCRMFTERTHTWLQSDTKVRTEKEMIAS